MAKIEKLKPLENQKVRDFRDGQYKVVGDQPPSNGKIQNKINEIINKLNEIIEVINDERRNQK